MCASDRGDAGAGGPRRGASPAGRVPPRPLHLRTTGRSILPRMGCCRRTSRAGAGGLLISRAKTERPVRAARASSIQAARRMRLLTAPSRRCCGHVPATPTQRGRRRPIARTPHERVPSTQARRRRSAANSGPLSRARAATRVSCSWRGRGVSSRRAAPPARAARTGTPFPRGAEKRMRVGVRPVILLVAAASALTALRAGCGPPLPVEVEVCEHESPGTSRSRHWSSLGAGPTSAPRNGPGSESFHPPRRGPKPSPHPTQHLDGRDLAESEGGIERHDGGEQRMSAASDPLGPKARRTASAPRRRSRDRSAPVRGGTRHDAPAHAAGPHGNQKRASANLEERHERKPPRAFGRPQTASS